eukprot:XP_001691173.1 predicted protein [Chlamydomonas reinhardtii]
MTMTQDTGLLISAIHFTPDTRSSHVRHMTAPPPTCNEDSDTFASTPVRRNTHCTSHYGPSNL